MKRIAFAALLMGCAIHTSFMLSLDDGTTATSTDTASGSVNNAGFLTLSDTDWSLTMNLVGIAPGNHPLGNGAGELQLARAATGDTFMTSLGGTCNVWLDAHGATNGSPVNGHFTCTGLVSTTGKIASVTNATFDVQLEDPANNPLHK